MTEINGIGFDLFNTLVTFEEKALREAILRLTANLKENGVQVQYEEFVKVYHEAVLKFLEQSKKDGKEGHNRFWISDALGELGHNLLPESPEISSAVNAYFSVFVKNAKIIPDTLDMLAILRKKYRLGLLSNFTHPPIAMDIISTLGLRQYFDVILISGDLGYRKPHYSVFQELINRLKLDKKQIAFIGDDQEADIQGAMNAGLWPIWTTFVRDQNIESASKVFTHYDDDVDLNVSRISNWQDLFAILNGKK